eukprot:403362165
MTTSFHSKHQYHDKYEQKSNKASNVSKQNYGFDKNGKQSQQHDKVELLIEDIGSNDEPRDFDENLSKNPLKQKPHQDQNESPRKPIILIKETQLKYLTLVLTSSIVLGAYFSYDNPGAIEKALEQDLDISQTQYSLLYAVYSYPNMILPIFGGIIIDVLGLRFGLLIFGFTSTLGQALTCLGGYLKNFWVILAGRMLFGLGTECLSVGQSTIVSKWFTGPMLSFVFGMNIALGNLLSYLNGIILPKIYNVDHLNTLGDAFLVGTVLMVLSFLSIVALCIVDKAEDKRIEINKQIEKQLNTQDEKEVEKPAEKFQLSDIKDFKFTLWVIIFLMMILYSVILPFQEVAGKIMQFKFSVPEDIAVQLFAIPNLIAAFTCPFVGIIADRFNIRVYLIIFSCSLFVITHTLNMVLPVCSEACYYEIIPLVTSGLAYSIYAGILWALIPNVVSERIMGTAYGFCATSLNIGLSTIPTLGSYIHDQTIQKDFGYFWQSSLWLLLSIIGLFFSIILQIQNKKYYNGSLNNSEPTKEQIDDIDQQLTTNEILENNETSIENDNKQPQEISKNNQENSDKSQNFGQFNMSQGKINQSNSISISMDDLQVKFGNSTDLRN